MPAMDKAQTLHSLTDVFREVFDKPDLVLTEAMTAADVENWDSLNHIDLIVAVERKFKIKFTTREVTGLKTVGDLAELTAKKASASS
jgi:acyl carrier protein